MNLKSVIRAARLVAAPRERVWLTFTGMITGPTTLPGRFHAPAGLPDQPGEPFDLMLRWGVAPLRGRAVIAAWRPVELVAWRGRVWGLSFTQALIFNTQGTHCLLESHQTIHGWSIPPAQFLMPPRQSARLAADWLRELAYKAEAQAGEIPSRMA
jgi:hypothetical protein